MSKKKAATRVEAPPNGMLYDYVPFYFAPRSPVSVPELTLSWWTSRVSMSWNKKLQRLYIRKVQYKYWFYYLNNRRRYKIFRHPG
ncbi:DarT ssDNA thymidine ADP-ribosyltransferase family protein [Salibacterium salarium]|uniref:DarT ssDNA thymidine ADP-ribosyltransferase family protein n=1 Tax=Salibacterium salarium TaxID=284579 RepID=UPI00163AC84B